MKKFGFSRGDSGEDDPSRSALFGRKKQSPAPVSDNPYAQAAPSNDPYAQSTKAPSPAPAYQQSRPGGFQTGSRSNSGSSGAPGGLPSGPGPRRGPSSASTYSQPPPAYASPGPNSGSGGGAGSGGGGGGGGYGSDRYGASGGYGDNRYDNNSRTGGSGSGAYAAASRYGSAAAASRGPGGYGGLGPSSSDADSQRDQLFSGAQQRQQQRQQTQPETGSGGYGQPGGDNEDPYGGYGADRQLTEEEMEEQEVKNIKKQMQDTRQESINSLNRSIALAHQAADTGINTMNILARDEERLLNTEKRLDEAANYNKIGAERAKKLKHLNRSMFAVHVNNPFTSERKAADREQAILENHRSERDLREQTRKAGWDAHQEMGNSFRDMQIGPGQQKRDYRPSAAETNKYVFTDDDEEENAQAMEDESTIARQMGELGDAVGILNRVAKQQTQTVERQVLTADRINQKVDAVDDGVRVNRARLDRIR